MNTIKNLAGIFTGLLLSLFALSCNDDLNDVGLVLKEPIGRILVNNDSLTTVECFTYESENNISVSTSNNLLIGYLNDPIFGTFINNCMFEIAPSSTDITFDSLPVADSLILYFDITAAYGDTTTPQRFVVYEIDTTMPLSNLSGKELGDLTLTGYYDRTKPLADTTFYPNPADTMPLRIKLNKDILGSRLFDNYYYQIDGDDSTKLNKYSSTDTFNELLLRGFVVEAKNTDGTGSILTVSLTDSSRMILYYKTAEYEDSTYQFKFNFTSTNKANIFSKNIKSSLKYNPMYTEVVNAADDSVVYIKNNNALYSKIKLSGLKHWADSGNIAINRARITLQTVDQPTQDEIFAPLSSIYATRDYNFQNALLSQHGDYTNYVPTEIELDTATNSYEVILTYEIQNAINNGNDSLIINIMGANDNIYPNRTILKGAKHSTDPLKLYITYTKINPN